MFCQQYTSGSTARLREAVERLEADITNLELDPDPTSGHLLRERRLELSAFLRERVKGALVRSRFLRLEEMDAPSSFFFNLERSVARRKQMACLQLLDGRVTTSPEEMNAHARGFYSNLFGADPCCQESRVELQEGLPQLSEGERTSLDCELTLEELTVAANQMTSGRAPGIDGLSADFFKRFWPVLGRDLHSVLAESLDSGSLPVSCQRAVLSLLPKKGPAEELEAGGAPMRGLQDSLQSTFEQAEGSSGEHRRHRPIVLRPGQVHDGQHILNQ